LRRKRNTITVKKREHLVIIEHCIHWLNPKSIDWTIQNHPSLSLWFLFAQSTHHWRENTFMPFQVAVHITKQLLQINRFRVQDFMFDLRIFLGILLIEGIKCIFKHFPASGFATHWSTNQHVTVPCVLTVIQLHYLLYEFRFRN
jgi:hypothetical protein